MSRMGLSQPLSRVSIAQSREKYDWSVNVSLAIVELRSRGATCLKYNRDTTGPSRHEKRLARMDQPLYILAEGERFELSYAQRA